MARRRPALLSPTAYVRRAGFYKGLMGGSRGWLVAGGLFYGLRKVRTTFGRTEEIAAVERLKPGEFVTIRTIVPATRRQRRAAGKSGRGK